MALGVAVTTEKVCQGIFARALLCIVYAAHNIMRTHGCWTPIILHIFMFCLKDAKMLAQTLILSAVIVSLTFAQSEYLCLPFHAALQFVRMRECLELSLI